MLAATGVILGSGRASGLWARAALLRNLTAAIELLRCETLSRNPLSRIASKLAVTLDGKCGEFFALLNKGLSDLPEKGLALLWQECAEKCFGTALTKTELSEFNNLAAVIATGEEPERGFLRCLAELSRHAEEAERIALRDGRMWTSLGLGLGLMLAIVIV